MDGKCIINWKKNVCYKAKFKNEKSFLFGFFFTIPRIGGD